MGTHAVQERFDPGMPVGVLGCSKRLIGDIDDPEKGVRRQGRGGELGGGRPGEEQAGCRQLEKESPPKPMVQ